MARIQGLILAAGRGSRLGRTGEEAPKSLLHVGRRTLVEHQLDVLAEAGVGPVHMVVGYGADEVRESVGMRAEFISNLRWSCTNSLYSFWLAREAIKDDVLVLNCDVLFAPEIIERLLDVPGDAIAIDSSSGHGREQMKVRLDGDRITAMSKELPADHAGGENVGILKLTGETARMLFEEADQLVSAGHEKEWVSTAVSALAPRRDLKAVDIAGIPWVEIDFPVDLVRARKEIWPSIAGKSYRRARFRRRAGWALALATLSGAVVLGRWTTPPPMNANWETVPLESGEAVQISVGERAQGWWLMETGGRIEAKVVGPGPVRVESRLLDHLEERTPYVLEVRVDGRFHDYFLEVSRPSGKATHPRWAVGHKDRFTIDLPEGVHTLEVRMGILKDAPCLVRIRQPELATDE